MTTETAAVEAIRKAAEQSGDPVYASLFWVMGLILLVIAIARPVMGVIRQYKTDKAENARDSADEAVYLRLKQEVERNSSDIRKLIDEKNKWHEEAIELRARVQQLEQCEEAVSRMNEKLDEKDRQIRDRDDENRRLMLEILQLKDRLHQLELRLAEDDKKFCATRELKRLGQ